MVQRNLKFLSVGDYGGQGSVKALLIGAGLTSVNMPEDADIIVFNGGEDVATSLYGEMPVMRGINHSRSPRDMEEQNLFNKYVDKFFLGICRGSQMLNVLNGGKLWQHVDRHTQSHYMIDVESGKQFWVTSTHHQMMRPNLDAGVVLAVANEANLKMADGVTWNRSKNEPTVEDIEVVWYPGRRTLCVQGHPEYVPDSLFAEYVLDQLDRRYNESA